MTIYNVSVFREMRLAFGGIEADSHEAAAAIARDKPTEQADSIDDECDGENLAALVDVAGDEEHAQSRMIDFAAEVHRKAASQLLTACRMVVDRWELGDLAEAARACAAAIAQAETAGIRPGLPTPKLLEALKVSEGIVHWALDHGAPQDGTAAALEFIRAAIAEAEATGISPAPPAPRLLDALRAVLPYAWNERASLRECWERDDDPKVKEELEACDRALDRAEAAIARGKAANMTAGAPAGDRPARFEIEHDPAENSDRVYVLVDGKFDVAIIRTDEGVVVDIYPREEFEAVASTHAFDADVEPGQDPAEGA